MIPYAPNQFVDWCIAERERILASIAEMRDVPQGSAGGTLTDRTCRIIESLERALAGLDEIVGDGGGVANDA